MSRTRKHKQAELVCDDASERELDWDPPWSIFIPAILTPAPPSDWRAVAVLTRPEFDRIEVGIWVHLVYLAQHPETLNLTDDEHQAVMRDGRPYLISRRLSNMDDPSRILVVNPPLFQKLRDHATTFQAMREGGCNCGGWDCIEGELQAKAETVFTRRQWARMTLGERVAFLAEHELDVARATEDVLDVVAMAEANEDALWQLQQELGAGPFPPPEFERLEPEDD